LKLQGLAARPDGGLSFCLADMAVVCRPSGALWLVEERALVVADLHFEKGSSYARRGQMLPPYDTRETLDRLQAEVDRLDPRTVVLLGDSFHDAAAEARLSTDDRARMLALAGGRSLIWVQGNHDVTGPTGLLGDVVASFDLGNLSLVHEPAGAPLRGEVAGHLHPCARVRALGSSVRRRCFATDGERIILPAFGALTGGLNLRDAAFAPLMRQPPLALVLGADRVHPVGWASLRGD
jgi:DNA ligase-associated metallophosphoesterase